MSMTKRYLESLPKEQQDDILGLPPDEWVESAENEPGICAECSNEWPESQLSQDGLCPNCEPAEVDKFEQRDTAPLVKPRGKCVNIGGWDV
jgi:hypothetical protein